MTPIADLSDLTSVDNIVRVYREATPKQLARGLSWYSDTHVFASALDPDRIHRAAGIIAAVSPRVRWEWNMTMAARTYVDGFASGTLPSNCAKANAIYNGAAPLTVLGGDKVRNFYLNIVDPRGCDAVAIDRHAFDIAINRTSTDAERHLLGKVGMYETFASLYRSAARQIGVLPSAVQAVTWVVWRETRANNRAANIRAGI